MENYRFIPFDLSRAKTLENPSGLDVVDATGCDVTIVTTNYNSGFRDDEGNNKYPIFAITHEKEGDKPIAYNIDGEPGRSHCPNLWLKEKATQRKMTHQELAWWLRDCPEEHREFIYYDDSDYATGHKTVYHELEYVVCDADTPVDDILIRSNGGDWREPIISNGGEWSAPHITEEDYEL